MKKQQPISQRKLLGVAGLGWLFDAMDVGILSFIIAALHVEWNLSPDEMKWIGSVNSIGMAAGAFMFGLLADRIGRKKYLLSRSYFLNRKRHFSICDKLVRFSYITLLYRDGAWR